MALIYRAYFAFSNNHRINSKDKITSAVFGFTNTLLDVLKKEKTYTHCSGVDTAAPTSDMKSLLNTRRTGRRFLKIWEVQFPLLWSCVKHSIFRLLRWTDMGEADDIIGTLAVQAEKDGFDTYMMTLIKITVSLLIRILLFTSLHVLAMERSSRGMKCKRWEIERVDQVKDILGLMGDSVDKFLEFGYRRKPRY